METSPAVAENASSCWMTFSCTARTLTWPLRAIWNCGIACVLLGQLLNTICGILIAALANLSMPFFQSLATRSIFGAGMFWIISKATGARGVEGSRWTWFFFVLFLILASFHAGELFVGFELLPAGEAMSFGNLIPIFTFMIVWILGWESLNWKIAVGVLICTSGGVLISHPPILFGVQSSWTSSRLLGLVIELIASVSGGAAIVSLSRLGEDIDSLVVAYWLYATTALMSLVSLLMGFPSSPIWTISSSQGIYLSSFSIASSFASMLSVRGYQIVNATYGSAMNTMGAILSYILGYFFLGQKITVWAVSGTLLICIGIVMVAVGTTRPTAKKYSNPDDKTNADNDMEASLLDT